MKRILLICLLFPVCIFAQSVAVGTNTPNSSAMLDITSNTKGLLIPRMTEAQKLAIVLPATGLLIWQTDVAPGFYYNNGTPGGPKWYMLGIADTDWKLTGNAGTDPANNFLGTIDIQPLKFRVRNVWAGSIDSAKGTYIGFRAGQNDNGGNVAFGDMALSTNENGYALTAIGAFALEKNRGGYGNTALGGSALRENTTGGWNTAVGLQSMLNSTTTNENTAIGMFSLVGNKGDENVAAGVYTLGKNEGDFNVGLGHNAMYENTTGFYNTAVGKAALKNNTVGYYNLALGGVSLLNNDTGNFNVGVGPFALYQNKVDGNTALGYRSAYSNTSGVENTALGNQALNQNVTGFSNTAVGFFSMNANKSAYNTSVGARAMEKNTDGQGNTSIGYAALKNNLIGDKNTAVGFQALTNNLGGWNTAIGYSTLGILATGWDNVAIGVEAMQNSEGTARNVAIGTHALRQCVSSPAANGNVAIGYESASALTLGIDNVAIGTNSMKLNTTGGLNTAVGGFALSKNSVGHDNTAIGLTALNGNTSGDYNIALGGKAGDNNVTGSYNTFVGYESNVDASHLNATAVGYAAYAECGNCLILGSVNGKNGANVTVNVGIGTTAPAYRLQVGTVGDGSQARANAWNLFSDERYKTNIEEIPNALEKIDELHGYYYNWKTGEDKTRQAGLLAQEVEKVLPEVVSTDAEGYKSVEYGKMNALLLQALKEQQVQILELKQKLELLSQKQTK